MRGGSIPLLVWGSTLSVMLALNLIWTGDAIQAASFAFAVVVIWGSAVGLAWRSRRESLRRGAPGASGQPESIPTASLGAVLVAVAVASIVFGFAFGRFLVFFGAGLLIAALGLVLLEVLGERRARQSWTGRNPG